MPALNGSDGALRRHLLSSSRCVIHGLNITRLNSRNQVDLLATANTMTVRAAYFDFFFRPNYPPRIVLEGFKVQIPPRGAKTNPQNPPQLPTGGRQSQESSRHSMRVGEIVANHATLLIARVEGKKPLEFDIHSLALAPVATNEPMGYRVTMMNTLPPGELKAHGRLGPWNSSDAGKNSALWNRDF